ncbi:MAG: tRNA (adenosine(37)-N6)-threonylcarbamoyltransferase complex dimerization subunit type 1 TsaB, partial [Caldilineae bacterium]
MLVALDTATTTASVAIYDRERDALLAEQTWQARRRQTEETLPVLQEMLARLALGPDHIRALAVTTGPGSFTGVRIGVSMVKGMALGLTAPPQVLGLPTLCATTAPLLALAQAAGVDAVWAVLQAGRGRLNWAVFRPDAPLWRPTPADHHTGPGETLLQALAGAPGRLWVAGEVPPDLAEAIAQHSHVHVVDAALGLRRAGNLARLAARFLAAGVA